MFRLPLILLGWGLMVAEIFSALGQESCAQYQEQYRPQSQPEETYRLELQMMKRGHYCYDLPIFDASWRRRSDELLSSSAYQTTAAQFDRPFSTKIEGDYAVIYYPENPSLAPVFLYRTDSGWVLDRTAVIEKIHYGGKWMADDGDYPYLNLLKSVYTLQKGTSSFAQTVWQPE